MGAELIQLSAAPLNFAALSDIMQTDALPIFHCSLILLGLIVFIEQLVLKPQALTVLYYQLQDVVEAKGKILEKAQALVLSLLGHLRGAVHQAMQQVRLPTSARTWLTWKRTLILIQVMIGVVGFSVLAIFLWQSLDMPETWEEPTPTPEAFPRVDGEPCSDEIEITPPAVKLLAGAFIFAGGALQNCKAFMRMPLL